MFNRSQLSSFIFRLSIYVLTFALFLDVAQAQVYAVYGEGTYGSGIYGGGATASPTPTPSSSSGSSDSSSSSPPSSHSSCSAIKPTSTPDLFQINAQKESLTLFFAPSSGNRDRYFVSYSTEAGVDQHGFEVMNSGNGVISVEVKALQPNTTYYFKVRAGNGCQPGEWSNQLAAKTGQRFPTYRWSSLPQIVTSGVTRRLNPSAVTKIDADASTMTSSPTPSTTPTQRVPTQTGKSDTGTSVQKPQKSGPPSPTPATDAQIKQKDGGWWHWLLNLFRGS